MVQLSQKDVPGADLIEGINLIVGLGISGDPSGEAGDCGKV